MSFTKTKRVSWIDWGFSYASRFPRICEILVIPWILFSIFWIFWGRCLDGKHSFSAFQDNVFLNHPIFHFISKSFSSGEYPYWIKSILAGAPLYNTPLFSTLYPFYFFGFDLYKSPLEALTQIHYVVLFHVGILYLNTYVMLRIFHLPIIASILGATLFAFSVNTYTYLFWVDVIAPYSWLPLAVGSLYLLLGDQYPKMGFLLGIISYTLLTLASPSHPLIHLVYCTGFLFLCYLVTHHKNRLKQTTAAWRLALLTFTVIAFSSAAVIPPVLSMGDSIRWIDHLPPVVGHRKLPFEAFTAYQFSPRELTNVFIPFWLLRVIGNSYLGILPMFLAMFSIFVSLRNWIIVPLMMLGIYTLLSSTGEHLGLAYVNYYLPLWNKIREPGRHLVLFVLAFSTLSAFGFQNLTERIQSSPRPLKKYLIASGIFTVLLTLFYLVRPNMKPAIPNSVSIGAFLLFVAGLATLRYKPWMNGKIASGLLAAIVIGPQLCYRFHVPLIKDISYFNPVNLRSHRILEEISKIPNIGNYRLIIEPDRLDIRFWSMNTIYYDLRTFGSFLNPAPNHQWAEIGFGKVNWNYYKLLGAKYYLCESCSTPLQSEYRLQKEFEGHKLYSTEKARPRYFLANQTAQTYADGLDFYRKVEQNDDYLHKVFISAQDLTGVSRWLNAQGEKLEHNVLHESASQNLLKLRLQTNTRSLLVLNEYFNYNKDWTYSPQDWQVRVDGKRQEPLKVNLNQLAVPLPEGVHDIEFEYRPQLFVWLLWLHRGLLIALLVYLPIYTYRNMPKLKDWLRGGVADEATLLNRETGRLILKNESMLPR